MIPTQAAIEAFHIAIAPGKAHQAAVELAELREYAELSGVVVRDQNERLQRLEDLLLQSAVHVMRECARARMMQDQETVDLLGALLRQINAACP